VKGLELMEVERLAMDEKIFSASGSNQPGVMTGM
jgi:hypothetical protein